MDQKKLQLGRLGESLGFRLRRVQNHLSKEFQSVAKQHNLKAGLLSSLALISANPGLSQNELATAIWIDKSVAVKLINELEHRNFVKRVQDEKDKRRHALFTTSEGEDFLSLVLDQLNETENRALHRVDQTELKQLKMLLDSVNIFL